MSNERYLARAQALYGDSLMIPEGFTEGWNAGVSEAADIVLERYDGVKDCPQKDWWNIAELIGELNV